MDQIQNPFAPGAGTPPPEFTGREHITNEVKATLERLKNGRSGRSHMLIGLRGTGKTVLLNQVEQIAEEANTFISVLEAPEGKKLQNILLPELIRTLKRLNTVERAKDMAARAMGALLSFASTFKLTVNDVTFSMQPEVGTADSGNLETDLTDLFLAIGKAATMAERPWVLLVDEVQYLAQSELAALIVALHRTNQKALPIYVCGAGLPQLAKLSGDAKSYAERLFYWHEIGRLDPISAGRAIRLPVQAEGATITEDAIQEILTQTEGYPYFLQEWGYHAWNAAQSDEVIDVEAVQTATSLALNSLDGGFFRVRYNRLTKAEREYVFAMSELGEGPYESGQVAKVLNKDVKTVAQARSEAIKKGMIFSPSHGVIAFTVPKFEGFLTRQRAERPTY